MSGNLETAVERFLEHKRALGRKYNSEEHELRLLVRFASEHHALRLGQLTPALLEDFLASRPRPRPRSFNHLLGVVAGLLDWAVTRELLETSPLQVRRRRVTSTRVPFLFDAPQARRLLEAAAALPDNSRARQRGPVYRTIFALCYGLGLRAGEACGLRLGDIDTGRHLLVVRGGKFGKSRLVPHGPRIAGLVEEQAGRRRACGTAIGPDSPLFTFDGHRCVHPGTASQTFHHLVATLGLAVPDGVAPPRLHDLRHSFAVGCLLRWYREGLDPSARLHQLSTFMGHVDPVSTAVTRPGTEPGQPQDARSRTSVLGVDVTVEGVDLAADGAIAAISVTAGSVRRAAGCGVLCRYGASARSAHAPVTIAS